MIIVKILIMISAYLLGAVPFGFLFGKMKGIDIREHGSKNIGTTNTGRVLGKRYAIYTYILDMFKGFIFVFLFRFNIISSDYMVLSPALYGLLAVLGHTFPIYLNFKGGKAVATSSGFLLGYCPWLFLIVMVLFFVVLLTTKYVSLGSLLGAGTAVVIAIILAIVGYDSVFNKEVDVFFAIFLCCAGFIIFIRHKSNIKRLKDKQELKVKL